MSKKKNAVKKPKSRSDVPYSQRMLRQRDVNIAYNREDAAKIALMLAMVALNDVEGMGYKRLVRFANRLMPLVREYYEDRERMHAQLTRRLESMGFVVCGNEVYDRETWALIKCEDADKEGQQNAD